MNIMTNIITRHNTKIINSYNETNSVKYAGTAIMQCYLEAGHTKMIPNF